jgi:hypothetical protein
LLVFAASAGGQGVTRVSVDSGGTEANDNCFFPSISADGQIVVFMSFATNLVAGDTNGQMDVFVHDRSTGLTERISVDSSGAQVSNGSSYPAVSSDGQVVAFESPSPDLVAGDSNGVTDIFVHDRSTGVTERVSVDSSGAQGNDQSGFDGEAPAISADGQIVLFDSVASNLVAGDTHGWPDVFVHDRSTGITERVSVDSSGVQAEGGSYSSAISADGQIVAFYSDAANLVAGDTNGAFDVFVHDRSTGLTQRVSVDSSGTEGNDVSFQPSISADGRFVAFWSLASNLVSGDLNGAFDVFVHDRTTGATVRASVSSSGMEANDASFEPAISANGQVVTFHSSASNLVAADSNGTIDVFVHDLGTGITERASSTIVEADNDSLHPAISQDGQVVAFDSGASNLVSDDANGTYDVFVHEDCSTTASWSNYGAGWPGTLGVPSLTASAPPVLGQTITIDVGNSRGAPTVAVLFHGYGKVSIPTNKGGTLLADPLFTVYLSFPSSGPLSFDVDLPDDESLCGLEIDGQILEVDPGASKKLSFTAGLELILGN